MAELNPQPLPPQAIRVNVTRELAFNLEKVNKVTAKVMEMLGCPQCCSGHVLDFRIMEEFVVDPETLDVTNVIPGRQF